VRATAAKPAKGRTAIDEDLAVASSPTFLAIMERSEARYRAEGGLSTEQVRAELRARQRATRRTSVARRSRRKAVARRSRG
jgi:hypothetical protein